MPQDEGCDATFRQRSTDEDVSKLKDAALGEKIRKVVENGDGVWVFETATDPAVRLFRKVPRT